LNADKTWEELNSMLKIAKQYCGCIVLLWHNSYLDEFEHNEYINVYENALSKFEKTL